PRLEVLRGERLLVLEGEIVPLPERLGAAEPEDGLSREGGRARVLVERQRVVLPDDAELVGAVLVPDLLDARLHLAAERALEVAEEHQRDRCVALAPRRVLRRDGHRRVLVAPGAAFFERLGGDAGAWAARSIDTPHQHSPCQKRQEEADDGCSFLHHKFLFGWRLSRRDRSYGAPHAPVWAQFCPRGVNRSCRSRNGCHAADASLREPSPRSRERSEAQRARGG